LENRLDDQEEKLYKCRETYRCTLQTPVTASSTTVDEQDLSGNVSPLALAPDSSVIIHSSAEAAIRKVDEILLKFGLESRKVPLLELLETGSGVLWEGGNFLSYKESGNQQSRFVRPSYQDIYQIVQEKWKDKKPHSLDWQNCILISGTPGIGKSVFGEVLCAVVSQHEKPTLLFFGWDRGNRRLKKESLRGGG
jgi:hypothetical protein